MLLRIQEYDYKIVYRPGPKISVPECLSRLVPSSMRDPDVLGMDIHVQGRQTGGGGVGGVSTPPEFWMGELNTCQPPLILRKKFLGGVGSP